MSRRYISGSYPGYFALHWIFNRRDDDDSRKHSFKEVNDGFLPGGFLRLKNKFGFFKGEKLTQRVEQLIAEKTGDPNTTFLQLHNLIQEKGYRDLYITGTDLTYRCLRVFSYERYPNMQIKDALRISFSIPLYFQPIVIDDFGTVHKTMSNQSFHLMVDGGLISNYPIQIFDSSKYMKDTVESNTFEFNRRTLELLLDKPEQLIHDGAQNYPLTIGNLKEYFSAVYKPS